MRVDVVIDTVCPWCYVGKRRLDEAMVLRPEQQFDVTYHPFLLVPDMPREGRNRQEFYEERFGQNNRMKEMTAALMAQAGDIDFQFDAIERAPNTVDSHRLVRWAHGERKQMQTVEALFHAFFSQGKDIGKPEVLVEIAETAGLDAPAFATYLENDGTRDDIKQLAIRAAGMGISGVPFYIFNNQIALSGAQAAETIAAAIDKAAETQAA